MTQPGNVHQQVLAIAWPMILAGASVPLLGIVDTAILGHLNDSRFLSAVAVGSSALSLLLWLLAFLRMGTTGPTARAFGAQNQRHCQELLWQSLILALVLGVALIILQQPILSLVLWLLGPSEEIYHLTYSYSQIRLFAAPATLCSFAAVGWLLGLQRAKQALVIMFTTNALNIGFDFLFIIGLGLNSDGAAWASLIAEYLGLIVALLMVKQAMGQFTEPAGREGLRRLSTYTELLLVNRDLFLRTACIVFVFTFFTAQGARLGDDVVAANAILMQLVLLASYGLDGFAHAAETLTGSAIGARNQRHFYTICRSATLWGFVIALFTSAAFWLFETPIVALFTNLPHIAALTHDYYLWMAVIPLLSVWCYLLDGVFLGGGRTTAMRNVLLIATLAIFLPAWWLTQGWHNHGLWLAFLLFMVARSVIMAIAFALICRRGWLVTSPVSD